MKLLRSTVHYPELNLALEEALLREADDYLLVYQNVDSVVCGKHQVLMAEINTMHCFDEQIPLYRRLSGGGTVYHDMGNVNFSIIRSKNSGSQVDFRASTEAVVSFLRGLGLDAHFGGHNDIRVAEFKVSGNAEHVYKNRVLHHGTLLYSSDIESLRMALEPGTAEYSGYRVQSVPARVANISSFETRPMGIDTFIKQLMGFLKDWYAADLINVPADSITERSEELAATKYATEDWIFGHSPDYQYDNVSGPHRIRLKVSRGYITEAHFFSENPDVRCIDFEKKLPGCRHMPGLADELSTMGSCLTVQELRTLLS